MGFRCIRIIRSTIKIEEECPSLNPDLSEQYVLSCLPAAANTYGKGCWGGNPSAALYYIFDNGPDGNNYNGIIFESCFPYQASHEISCDDKCAAWQDCLVPLKNTSELWLGFDSLENREIIKNQIFHNGPVAAAMNVTEEFTRYWQLHHKETDYFPDTHAPWGEMLNHIILIIGWKDDPSITNGGYWICKNSWGTDWGYDGFYNIEYGALFTGYLITWGEYDAAAFDWPPIADPGPYRTAQTHEELIFDGSQSIDPESEIISYHWEFGDGTTATGIQVNHSYQQPGIYLVNLTVTDSSNKTGTETTIVGVDETPFRISFKSGLGITIKILNLIDFQHQDVTWNAELKGLVFAQKTNGYIYQINIDQEKKIVLIAMGVGPGKITFECNGFTATTWFIILGPLIFILG